MKVGSSKFNLTHERKFSCDFGRLIPILVEDVVPGDHFSNTTELFVRLAPQRAPVMHRVSISTHFFFVPNRLIWRTTGAKEDQGHGIPHNGWERYITGYDVDGNYIKPTDEREPQIGFNYEVNGVVPENRKLMPGYLPDYLYGIPCGTDTKVGNPNKISVSALPLRAYNLIWNEWYRDEDLQKPLQISFRSNDIKVEGTELAGFDTFTDCLGAVRGFEKDYFTSCRSLPQKGPAVELPLSGDANVYYNPPKDLSKAVPRWWAEEGTTPFTKNSSGQIGWSNTGPTDGETGFVHAITGYSSPEDKEFQDFLGKGEGAVKDGFRVDYDPQGTLTANLKTATGSSINALRVAFQTQKFLERNARSGARYVEQILCHFGVRSPDYRLDRPEFLGGGKSMVMFSEVLQTAQPNPVKGDDGSPLGAMAGHGFSAARNHGFSRHFTEHGWIIGLLSVLPRTAYQQGVPKRFSRTNRYDYYFPEFAHLGEQGVKNKEIYVQDDLTLSDTTTEVFNEHTGRYDTVQITANEDVFGYQAIWDEYRKRESSVHGDFRSNLSYWHMGRIFSAPPTLSSEFVGFQKVQTSDRVWAVTGTDPVWVQLVNHMHAIRKMPAKGIPGMLDHF